MASNVVASHPERRRRRFDMHRMMALAVMAMMALRALSGVSAHGVTSDRTGDGWGGGSGWGDGGRGGRAVSYINPDTGTATENADVNRS